MSTRTFDRNAALHSLRTDRFDVVVIGGGITGAGVVLDAASRGLRAALIERDDFASGTSSKSSKLVHGGIRYLQQGEVGLVYEALHERRRLLDNAPHLVEVLPFLIPLMTKGGLIPKKLSRTLGAAMWAYDVTGGWRIGKFHKRISTDEAIAHMPHLDPEKIGGAYLYYDATADDARLVVTVLRTAALQYGATIANRVSAVGFEKTDDGKAVGVIVDVGDGSGPFVVQAQAIVNATGVWADDVRSLDEHKHPRSIRPAKGVHITVPFDKVGNDIAGVIPVPSDRRSVFVVPWGESTYIGTTDTDYTGPVDDPVCTDEDRDYLLAALNYWSTLTLTADDVTGSWAGLRPLVAAADSGRTADLSRRHRVAPSDAGIVTVTGGKLTTYRRMAQDTVDLVVKEILDAPTRERTQKCQTKRLRLRGGDGLGTVSAAAAAVGITDPSIVASLTRRYGSEAKAVLLLVRDRPELAEPLVPGLPYLKAEAIFAVRHEMATTLDDVLSRRTRALLHVRDESERSARSVAALIAPELGWGADEIAAQVADFEARCARERVALAHRAPAPEVIR